MPAAWLGLRTSVVPSIPSTDTTHTRPVFLTVAVIFWLISSPWCPGRIGQSHGRSRDRPRGRARPPALPAGPRPAAAQRAMARQERSAPAWRPPGLTLRSEEHTSELQSRGHLVCRLLLEKK